MSRSTGDSDSDGAVAMADSDALERAMEAVLRATDAGGRRILLARVRDPRHVAMVMAGLARQVDNGCVFICFDDVVTLRPDLAKINVLEHIVLLATLLIEHVKVGSDGA